MKAIVAKGPLPVPCADFELTIAGRFPSLNDILRVKASRWRGKWNAMKVEWQGIVRRAWEGAGKPRVVGAYSVRYLYIVSDRKRDLSNIHASAEKIILDALVNCGAIEGDGFKFHVGSSYRAHVDPRVDAVRVHVVGEAQDF